MPLPPNAPSPQKRALVYGHSDDTLTPILYLLKRSCYQTTVLASKKNAIRWGRYIDELYSFSCPTELPELAQKLIEKNSYDLILPCDDRSLLCVRESSIKAKSKLKLLPVVKEENFAHLFSKFALSLLFKQKGVNTPNFIIAKSLTEAINGAESLGFPLLCKIDASHSGLGTLECKNFSDLLNNSAFFLKGPVMLQKQIVGRDVFVDAFFSKKRLLSFEYGYVLRVVGKFGISLVREYKRSKEQSLLIQKELEHIGQVLGADGFCNISCIEEMTTGLRYYFEADMRHNVWVDYGRFFSRDLAPSLKNLQPQAHLIEGKEGVLIHYLRAPLKEFFKNSHFIWKHIYLREIFEQPLVTLANLYTKHKHWPMRYLRKYKSSIRKRFLLVFQTIGKQLLEFNKKAYSLEEKF